MSSKKTILLLVLLICLPTWGLSEVAKIVDPDNGGGTDYTSLDAWEDAFGGHTSGDGDLVSDDEYVTANCRSSSGSADTAAVDIDGWITDATRDITVQSMPGYLHDGTRGTGYHLVVATDWVNALKIQENYVTLDGLAVSGAGQNANGIENTTTGTANAKNCLVYDCTVKGFYFYGMTAGLIENCITYGNGSDGIDIKTANVYHCTSSANGSNGIIENSWGTLTVKNCYSGGNTGDDYHDGDGTLNLTTCHDADGTGDTTTAYSTSSGCYFTNVTASSEDLKISSASSTLNADETTTDGVSATDFQGTTRAVDDPYAGAHEYVAIPSGGQVIIIQMSAIPLLFILSFIFIKRRKVIL